MEMTGKIPVRMRCKIVFAGDDPVGSSNVEAWSTKRKCLVRPSLTIRAFDARVRQAPHPTAGR